MNILSHIPNFIIHKLPVTWCNELLFRKAKLNVSKYASIKNQKKVFLFLAADYGNLGDIAITFAQSKILKKYYPDYLIVALPITKTLEELRTIKEICQPNDVVTIIGGGNMGDLYYEFETLRELVIRKFKGNKIISFPQTIDFSNSRKGRKALSLAVKIYSEHPQLTILAREEKSYSVMKNTFSHNKIMLTPDIVMTLDYLNRSKNRNGIVICMRNDKEKYLNDVQYDQLISFSQQNFSDITYYDTHIDRNNLSEREREDELGRLLDTFASAKLVLTDRLHGMIFCYIIGTPAIVFPNSNSKVEKCFEWIKDCGYIKFSKQTDSNHLGNLAATVCNAPVDKEMFKNKQLYFERLISESF